MRVIPSTLLLCTGTFVTAQDAAVPALIATSSLPDADVANTSSMPADSTQLGNDSTVNMSAEDLGESDPPVLELFESSGSDTVFGDFGGLLSGIFGGDSTTNGDGQDDMFGINELLSGMFGGEDADAYDGQENLEDFFGNNLGTFGTIDLECPSSCENTDLCKVDLMSLMMGGTDTLQEMCNTGCIPTIILSACGNNMYSTTSDEISEFISSTGVCDFVNCCVAEEQEDNDIGVIAIVASPTGAKFNECKGKLDQAGAGANTDTVTATAIFDSAFGADFNTTDFQDIIEEVVDGLEEVLDGFGDILSDLFSDMFQSMAIPAFCAVDTCSNAPNGFCECFNGDLANCNAKVISQACTADAFSTCAPEGFTEFCNNECAQSDGLDIFHMCSMCEVVTCCSKDSSEIEGCISDALSVDHFQGIMDDNDVDAAFSELEDFIGGIDLDGMLTEFLGNFESMKWCPEDKTCPNPLGEQFCDMMNGDPPITDSAIAVSPRSIDIQDFDFGGTAMDLDRLCSEDMILSCGPVDMKAKCDNVCGTSSTDGILKEAFCHLCSLATCCEGGNKTFSECSSVAYVPTDSSIVPDSDEPIQDSTPQPPIEDTVTVNNASDEELEESDFNMLDPEEAEGSFQITAIENSKFERENSAMTFKSVSFVTAIISAGLILVLN